jgi:hypothetical protein
MLNIKNGVLISCDGAIPNEFRLPEGITVIGKSALPRIECSRLVMPSTLKKIDAFACFMAAIGTIDFGECKLEAIEICGLGGCEAKAELPDTVRKIGALSLNRLKMAKGRRLALPKALRYIGNAALNLSEVDEIMADEGSVTDESNLANALHSCTVRDSAMVVHVMREDKELYNFVFFRGLNEGSNYEWCFKNLYIGANGLDICRYDTNFLDLKRVCGRIKAAAGRVLVPYKLPEDKEKMYREYAKSHYSDLMAGKMDDSETIMAYAEADLISLNNLKTILQNAREKGDAVLVAFLIDLMHRRHGPQAKSLKL